MIDRTTKLLLAAIALGLFANAVVPLLRPVKAKAAENFKCEGELKANAWGGIKETLGGYKVEIECEPN